MKFTFNINAIVQGLGILGQGFTMISSQIPEGNHLKEIIVLSIGVIQAVSALLAHIKNPDGAPASEPFVKKQ